MIEFLKKMISHNIFHISLYILYTILFGIEAKVSIQTNRMLRLLLDFSFKFPSTKTYHIFNTFSHKLSSIHNERKSKQMISDDEVEKRTPFIHFSSYLSIHVFHIHISETQRRVLLLVKNMINIFLPLEKES